MAAKYQTTGYILHTRYLVMIMAMPTDNTD